MMAAATPFFNKIRVKIFRQAFPRHEWDQNSPIASWNVTDFLPQRKTGSQLGDATEQTIIILQTIMTLLCSFSGISGPGYNSANRQDWPSLSWPTLLVKASQSVLLPGRMET